LTESTRLTGGTRPFRRTRSPESASRWAVASLGRHWGARVSGRWATTGAWPPKILRSRTLSSWLLNRETWVPRRLRRGTRPPHISGRCAGTPEPLDRRIRIPRRCWLGSRFPASLFGCFISFRSVHLQHAPEPLHLFAGQCSIGSALQSFQIKKSDPDSPQLFDKKAEMFEHDPDLILAAFGDGHFVPGVHGGTHHF
jgi:hypothetical protein